MAISHGGLQQPQQQQQQAGSPLSRSTCLRERGNTLYHEATSQTSLPSIRSCRLEDAIRLYSQALSLSQSDSERAMCCKNLGQAFWARSKLTLALADGKSGSNPRGFKDSSEKFFDSLSLELLNSVGYFLEALNYSRPGMQSKEWVQGIHWKLVDIAWTVDDIRESSPIGGRIKGRFLAELCSVFQQKLPPKSKLQASAIVHKACAHNGLRNAMCLDQARFAKQPVLQDCLFQLSVAQAHTDPSAVSFLAEIGALREEIVRQIEVCKELGARDRLQNRSFSAACDGNRGNLQARFKRNQSYSEGGKSGHAMHGRCSSMRERGSSQPSDLEVMFNSLCPREFLQELYLKYPPPGKKESCEIRQGCDLKTAYKKAISHYHPDHHDLKQAKLADEITKYLIINFNGLKGNLISQNL